MCGKCFGVCLICRFQLGDLGIVGIRQRGDRRRIVGICLLEQGKLCLIGFLMCGKCFGVCLVCRFQLGDLGIILGGKCFYRRLCIGIFLFEESYFCLIFRCQSIYFGIKIIILCGNFTVQIIDECIDVRFSIVVLFFHTGGHGDRQCQHKDSKSC